MQGLEYKLVIESEVTKDLDKQIRDLLVECFPQTAYYFCENRGWKGSTPSYSVVMFDGERLVGHLSVIERYVMISGEKYKTAGFQNVGIVPDFRGKSLLGNMLQMAMDEAKRQDFDLMLLFSGEKITKAYSKWGWKAISNKCYQRIDGQLENEPWGGVPMFYSVKLESFPAGDVDLQGRTW